MNGNVLPSHTVQPRRIQDIPAILGLVECICKQHVAQIVARILKHRAYISYTLVIEETMRGRIDIFQVIGAITFHHITGLIIQFTEIPWMGLDLHTDPFLLEQRKQLIHRAEPHTVTDLLLVRVAGKLGIDHLYSHIHRDLDNPFPVCHCNLPLFLRRAGPTVYYNKG